MLRQFRRHENSTSRKNRTHLSLFGAWKMVITVYINREIKIAPGKIIRPIIVNKSMDSIRKNVQSRMKSVSSITRLFFSFKETETSDMNWLCCRQLKTGTLWTLSKFKYMNCARCYRLLSSMPCLSIQIEWMGAWKKFFIHLNGTPNLSKCLFLSLWLNRCECVSDFFACTYSYTEYKITHARDHAFICWPWLYA